MGDYKTSIFLPKTSFAMKGNLSLLEPQLLDKWCHDGLYDRLRKKSKGQEKFILHWGPPYANGSIHLGHVLSEILKDILNRTMQMKGYDAPLVPGWDCHGLPIEWKVEENFKAQGRHKKDIPHREFRQACRDFAHHWIEKQKEQFQRLGILADWTTPYITMDYSAEAATMGELFHLLESGYLYKGVRPVMWSVVEQTALAEAEIEYEDHTSSSIYVLFPIKYTPHSLLENARILIWTTTPWSLPGNRAICYHPDITYAVVKTEKWGHVIIAHDLMDKVFNTLGIEYTFIKTLEIKELEHIICHHPLVDAGYDFDVPLLPGDHVTVDAGTGLVHTAPCHGPEDFGVGQRFNLDIPDPIDESGHYRDSPLVAGIHVFKADAILIEALKTRGYLVHHSFYKHSYPHSWRSKAPLIYRATAQWFVSMSANDLRDKALRAIDEVQWLPAGGKNRITGMVKNRPDWCLSRQRAWGVPIAFFIHKTTGQPLIDKDVNERILHAIEHEGCDAWFDSPKERFLGEGYNAHDFEQSRDILDVWFDSGATQSYVLDKRPELERQAHIYFEGSDQHRGWFQSSLLMGCAHYGNAPFKTVLTHGFCLDSQGKKFSKSLGNGMAPEDIIKSSGAEILRLWVVGCDYTEDVRIGPDIIKHQQDIYRRFRNTLRYLLGALNQTPFAARDEATLPDYEKFMLHRLAELHQSHELAMKTYNFQAFYTQLHTFCSQDLSAFYFDIRKDTLYCDALHSPKRLSMLYVMHHIFNHLVHWLAPVLCFTAEEAWMTYHGHDVSSIHESTFPIPPHHWINKPLAESIEHTRHVRKLMTSALEEARAGGVIGSSLEAHLCIYGQENLDINWDELAIVSSYTLKKSKDFRIEVERALGQKCERCWKVLEEVKEDLCHRCHQVVQNS